MATENEQGPSVDEINYGSVDGQTPSSNEPEPFPTQSRGEEHLRLDTRIVEYTTIHKFVEWLSENRVMLAEYDPKGSRIGGTASRLVNLQSRTVDELALLYCGIDPTKFKDENREFLQDVAARMRGDHSRHG